MWKSSEYRAKQSAGMMSIGKDKLTANAKKAASASWSNPASRAKMLKDRAQRRKAVSYNGKVYSCIGDVAEETGISASTLYSQLKSNSQTIFYV